MPKLALSPAAVLYVQLDQAVNAVYPVPTMRQPLPGTRHGHAPRGLHTVSAQWMLQGPKLVCQPCRTTKAQSAVQQACLQAVVLQLLTPA